MINKFRVLNTIRGGGATSEVADQVRTSCDAVYRVCPTPVSWSLIAWNKQLPSLCVGGWRAVSPALVTSLSSLIFGTS